MSADLPTPDATTGTTGTTGGEGASARRLSYRDFKAMLMDPDVPDNRIAEYLVTDPERSGPFDPRLVPDPEKVEPDPESRFDQENVMRWGNSIDRWRRQQRFLSRVGTSSLPVLVSEGDSWFQFPFLVRDVIDQLGEDHLIWSLDAAGDTVENMVNRRPEYFRALQQQKRHRVAAFLFSGAGNDVIGEDELGEPVLYRLVKPHEPGREAAWHLDQAALATVLTRLRSAYGKIVSTVRSDPDLRTLPILFHGYDYALAGGHPDDPRQPLWAAQDKWLGRPLRDQGITDQALQRDVVRLLIDAVYDLLADVAGDSDQTGVYVVDVRGTLPDRRDWADEIHPDDDGFARVADRFREVLSEARVGV